MVQILMFEMFTEFCCEWNMKSGGFQTIIFAKFGAIFPELGTLKSSSALGNETKKLESTQQHPSLWKYEGPESNGAIPLQAKNVALKHTKKTLILVKPFKTGCRLGAAEGRIRVRRRNKYQKMLMCHPFARVTEAILRSPKTSKRHIRSFMARTNVSTRPGEHVKLK